MILEESMHPKSYSSSNFLNRLKSESDTDCFKHELKKKKKNTTKTRKEESNPWLELRHAHLEIRNAAWFSPSPRGWRCWQDPKTQLVRTHSLLNSKVWTQISTETGNGISHYRMGSLVTAQDWHIWESWGSKQAPYGEGTTPGCVGIFPSQTRYVPFIPASKPRSAGPLTPSETENGEIHLLTFI